LVRHSTQKLIAELSSKNKPAVMVHANWMNGKELKKAALARNGLWIARRRTGGPGDGPGGPGPARMKGKPTVGNWTCLEPSGALANIGKLKR
jgi:hypothetical protein